MSTQAFANSMKKTSLFALIGILIIVIGVAFANKDFISRFTAVTATGAATTSHDKILPYGIVTLKVKETARFKDSTITLLSVTSESRCPSGVQCIWAGTVKANILVVSGMGTSTETIELGKSATTEAEKIEVTAVNPYPTKEKQITQQEYKVTFNVTKGNDGGNSGASTGATQGGCYIGGCSSEVCSDSPNMASNCIYRPEFACYKANSVCKRQSNGQCGWTPNSALASCIQKANTSQ